MTDNAAAPKGKNSVRVRELVRTTRGVLLLRVVECERQRFPVSKFRNNSFVLAVPVDLDDLRRIVESREANRLQPRHARFVGWELDFAKRRLIAPGGSIAKLPRGECALLRAFVSHPRRPLNRSELANLTKRAGKAGVSGRTVDAYICRLRRRLRDCSGTSLISTVPRIGYSFDADVVHA